MGILSPTARQFLAVGCCNLLTLSFGLSMGWGTINNVELQNTNTTYGTGPLTQSQASLIVSLPNFGGFIGNFAIVPISMYFGVKRTMHLFGIPLILSSLMTIWMQNIYALYFARCVVGFIGGGIVVGIPLFVADISHNNIRGILNSMYDPSYNIGVLLSFYIGNHWNCVDQIKLQLIAPIIFILVLLFLPESPEHHIKHNNEQQAIKSQKFFRGKNSVADQIQFKSVPMDECIELDKTEIKRDTNCDTNRLKTVSTDKCVETGAQQQTNNKLALTDFLTHEAKCAMFISFTSLFLSFIGGVVIIFVYVTAIFNATGSSISDKDSSLLIALVQLSANIVVLNIVDRFNRRTLFLWSSVLTTAAFFLFSIHCAYWTSNPNLTWMPQLCFSSIIFFGSLGILPIPFIVTIEIFPRKILSAGLSFATSLMWVVLFIVGYAYPVIQQTVGVGNCFFGFGVITIIGAIFGYIYMPETRGKSYDEIMTLLRSTKICDSL